MPKIPTTLDRTRRRNLMVATAARGSKKRLAAALGLYNSDISNLINGRRAFPDDLARRIEKVLALRDFSLDVSYGTSPMGTHAALSGSYREPMALRVQEAGALYADPAGYDALQGVDAWRNMPPIAEALMKLLLQKAQEGRLPEDKALLLLAEIAAW